MEAILVHMNGGIHVEANNEIDSILSLSNQGNNPDLICFSHLRWNFVYQRPQHLMTRFGKICRTFFIEEPVFNDNTTQYEIRQVEKNITVIVPFLPTGLTEEDITIRMNELLQKVFTEQSITRYLFWYYTPMSLSYSNDFAPEMIVYDCMDELSAFKFAPQILTKLENDLLFKADIVFTGGLSLYEHKKKLHNNIFPFPSSIDKSHF